MIQEHRVSIKRACKAAGLSRAAFYKSPSSALERDGEVIEALNGIVERNKACIYISHNVSHVYQVADRIVMLDRGELVGEYVKKDLSPEELGARLMGIQAGQGVGEA